MPESSAPRVLWRPSDDEIDRSHLARYVRWLAGWPKAPALPPVHDEAGAAAAYRALWQWSVDRIEDFWESLWYFFELESADGTVPPALSGRAMPGARWFEGARLNYADYIFRQQSAERPAILFRNERPGTQTVSWAELEAQTAALAAYLREAGVGPGDRVAAYLPNTPHAVVAVLATMSLGAVWSSCSPDFGASSVADRFVQIEPRVLIAVDGYTYNGKPFDKRDVIAELCGLLPTVERVILIPYLDEGASTAGLPNAVWWNDALAAHPATPLEPVPVDFNHPIWILYSSGTTGVPKAITHSHGGNLLEHLKYLHFHNDIRPGERFFWFSTTGWMMWNFTVGALLTGATIVLYDGSPAYPTLDALWQLAAEAPIEHFGTSAPFLVSCMKAGLQPGLRFDLGRLRSIGSTGSPLPPEAFDWVYDAVKPRVWLSSMSGGTDVCTAWVGGNPWRPVYQGEIQCRCLGCAMEAWDEDGRAVPPGEVGEMVVTQPMPSMPVFFWNDRDGANYRASYFETYPGVWRHGDWLKITERDSLLILGRSDATLNRQGVRIGTAEIYRALDQLPELRDSLIVNLERADGSDWMPLFVSLATGVVLDDALRDKIRQTLRRAYSPRHVPDAIIEVADIPYTISGKKMEMPVKRILQRKPLDKAYNRDSMKNPEAMEFFIVLAEKLDLSD
jgi:acetoacetyl-CoA synthetase